MGEVQDGGAGEGDLEQRDDADDVDLDDAGDADLEDDDLDDDEGEPEALPPLDPAALAGVLEFLAKGLVDEPDKVRVESVENDGRVTLRLSVDQPDMGKVIGRSGRTARALRTLIRAAGVRANVGTHVEIVEE